MTSMCRWARFIFLEHGRFLQHLNETVDMPQRRAQIVRNGIGKGLEFLVRHFQQIGALLERFVQFLDVLSRLLAAR